MTPRLLLLTNVARDPQSEPFVKDCIEEASSRSVGVVVRDRSFDYRSRAALAQRLSPRARDQFLLVSDRLDLALALEADGVHLPADGILPGDARPRISGWLSRSIHGLDTLSANDRQALTALVVSPVFARRKGREPLGLEGLSRITRDLKKEQPNLRVYALGGVTETTASACLLAGADGVAVMSPLPDPERRRALLRALGILRS